MLKQEKAMTKDRLIGMKVVNSEGNSAGTIKDIAFTVGRIGMTLIVETEKSRDMQIPWDHIQAAGDYVLLKPPVTQTEIAGLQVMPQAQIQQSVCPTCKGQLSYIQEYQRWYCFRCQKYI